MRRNWELVRKILRTVAELPAHEHLDSSELQGYEDEPHLVSYHIGMMYEAGLITAIDASTVSGSNYLATGLTWEGNEFLENIESDTAWSRVKSAATDKGLALSFEVIKTIASAYIKHMAGLSSSS